MEPFRLLIMESVLELPDRPIMLFPGLLVRELPGTVRAGDAIELRRPDGTCISTIIAGIRHARMLMSDSQWPIRMPDTVKASDVANGTEVWWISNKKP